MEHLDDFMNFYLIEVNTDAEYYHINAIISGVKEGKPTVYRIATNFSNWIKYAKVYFYGKAAY